MITSARHRSEAGFTLVELLVVIFIIGMMSSVVVMSMPSRRTLAEKDAERLAIALRTAGRVAISSGEPIRWTRLEGENLFERYRLGEWEAAQGQSRTFSRARKDEALQVSVELLDVQTRPHDEGEDGQGRQEVQPSVIFMPTGESTPALITVLGDGYDARLEVGYAGELSLDGGAGR